MATGFVLDIGVKLENGATVIDVERDRSGRVYVAADRGACGLHQFATWGCDSQGNCFWGHYFDTRSEALADLVKRAGR